MIISFTSDEELQDFELQLMDVDEVQLLRTLVDIVRTMEMQNTGYNEGRENNHNE